MKNIKKLLLCIGLALIMIVTPVTLMACGNKKEKPILNIDIIGEYNENFHVGDDFDYDNLKLFITYKDDSTKIIDIEKYMLKNFDTSEETDSNGKTFFVYYKDWQCKRKYYVTAYMNYGYYDWKEYNKKGKLLDKQELSLRFLSNQVLESYDFLGAEDEEQTEQVSKNFTWTRNSTTVTIKDGDQTYATANLINDKTLKIEREDGAYTLLTYHETIKFGFYDKKDYTKDNELISEKEDAFEYRDDGNIIDRSEGSLVYTYKWAYKDGQIVYTTTGEVVDPYTVIDSETLKQVDDDGEYHLITFSHA